MNKIKKIENKLSSFTHDLDNHTVYSNLNNIQNIRTFMEYHVFAVWDFMSILKALQLHLTGVKIPWTPSEDPLLSRFINEITLGEESDINELGIPKSHFEMYIDAMEQIKADTTKIKNFIDYIKVGQSVDNSLNKISINKDIIEFVNFSFSIIRTNKPHLIASLKPEL